MFFQECTINLFTLQQQQHENNNKKDKKKYSLAVPTRKIYPEYIDNNTPIVNERKAHWYYF